MEYNNEYKTNRLNKLENWKEIQPKYPDKFLKTHSLSEANFLNSDSKNIFVAGRIINFRQLGKICFIKLQDFSSDMQIVLDDDLKNYDFFMSNLDIGDIIGIEGFVYLTERNVKSIKVVDLTLLTKCLHPLPEKWYGLNDDEIKIRQRYLDLIVNSETRKRFKFRHKLIKELKNFLDSHDFIEVETPILQKQASGALASPFKTHHNALDIDLFMRIAPETYLKRIMAGGYERVYEIGKCFRNEGIDPTHLQEFTMLEFYTAYWNYEDAIDFVEKLFAYLFKALNVEEYIKFDGASINIMGPWKRVTYNDLFKEHTGFSLENLLHNEKLLFSELSKIINVKEYKSAASLIDAVYKRYCRPKLIDPVIITNQPSILGPLARQNIDNPLFSDRFQVVINTLEVVNAYSELVDPILQRSIFIEQQALKKKGDDEAMESEEDFLLAMEHAMPPMAGVGIGIDRIISILTDSTNLRDVIFFPNVK